MQSNPSQIRIEATDEQNKETIQMASDQLHKIAAIFPGISRGDLSHIFIRGLQLGLVRGRNLTLDCIERHAKAAMDMSDEGRDAKQEVQP